MRARGSRGRRCGGRGRSAPSARAPRRGARAGVATTRPPPGAPRARAGRSARSATSACVSRSRFRNAGPPCTASIADRSTSAAMPSSPALSATWAARTAGTSGRGMASPDSPMTLEAWSSADSARSGAPSSAMRMPSAISEIATWDDVGYSTSGAAARMARARSTSPSTARHAAASGAAAHASASVRPTYASAPRRSIPFRAQMAAATFITRGRSGCSVPVSRPSTRRSAARMSPAAHAAWARRPASAADVAARFDRGGVEAPCLDGLGGQRLVGLSPQRLGDPRVAEAVHGELERRRRPAGGRRPRRHRPARAASATARAPACSAGS